MATVLEIITGAALELGARPIGDDLSAEEADRGLVVIQAMFREAVDKGVFGRVVEVLATEDTEAKEQERIYKGAYAVTLPTTIVDEYTGDDRRPHDLAMIQVVGLANLPEISIYDAELADWVRLDNLTLAGDCPLGNRNRHGLECALARKLASSFQRPVPDTTSAYANGLASVLSMRLSAPRVTTRAEYL